MQIELPTSLVKHSSQKKVKNSFEGTLGKAQQNVKISKSFRYYVPQLRDQ